MLGHVLLCALVASAAAAGDIVDLEEPSMDPRLLFLGNTTGLTVNLSTLLASGVAGLAGLLLLAVLAYLVYILTSSGDYSGYSGSSGHGSGSSGYSARAAYV